jgi:hypothetical protein
MNGRGEKFRRTLRQVKPGLWEQGTVAVGSLPEASSKESHDRPLEGEPGPYGEAPSWRKVQFKLRTIAARIPWRAYTHPSAAAQ